MELQALLWLIMPYGLSFVGLYFLGALLFLFSAQLDKGEDGSLTIDHASWHYRLCEWLYGWPSFKLVDVYERDTNTRELQMVGYLDWNQIGLCGYYFRLFWAIAWWVPFHVILHTVKTIVYAPFCLLFGYRPRPLTILMNERDPLVTLLGIETVKINFPRVWKLELKPYLFILPAIYFWSWHAYPERTGRVTWGLGYFILAVAIVVGIILLADFILHTDNKRVSLAREFLKDRKQGACRPLKVRLQTGTGSK